MSSRVFIHVFVIELHAARDNVSQRMLRINNTRMCECTHAFFFFFFETLSTLRGEIVVIFVYTTPHPRNTIKNSAIESVTI